MTCFAWLAKLMRDAVDADGGLRGCHAVSLLNEPGRNTYFGRNCSV